jgi:hypothetical protein
VAKDPTAVRRVLPMRHARGRGSLPGVSHADSLEFDPRVDSTPGVASISVDSSDAACDPASTAVIELLGMLAYGELLAFDRMAADARLAPDLRRRAMLSEMAAVEITNYRRVAARLAELGVSAEQAMEPYAAALRDYHDSTEPKDWLEALTKAYVGHGLSDNFVRDIAELLAEPERGLIWDLLHDSRYDEFAATEIRAAIAADPKVANRLSMWGRRLVGEGLSQAQRVAAERPALTALIVAGYRDQSGVQRLFNRLTTGHTARMSAVGLNN